MQYVTVHPTLSLYFAEADSVTHVALARWVISFTGSQAARYLRAHAIAQNTSRSRALVHGQSVRDATKELSNACIRALGRFAVEGKGSAMTCLIARLPVACNLHPR
jgi:hypothetical protein